LPELAGKTAVVTGASSGIGAAIADRLEAAGADVQRVSRRGPVALDVSDRAAVTAFLERLDRLDILVCAAGDNLPARRLEQLTGEAWDRLLGVNLTGAFNFVQVGLQKLRKAHGDVLLVASISGQWPDLSGPAYQASKAAVLGLTRGAAMTYGAYQQPPFPEGTPIADAHGLWYSVGNGIVLFANNSWNPMSNIGGQLAGRCV